MSAPGKYAAPRHLSEVFFQVSGKDQRKEVPHLKHRELSHPGLYLDKLLFLPREGEASEDLKHRHVENAARIAGEFRRLVGLEPNESFERFYEAAFTRWREAMTATGAQGFRARTSSKLIVGLGAGSVLETSITLHRTYGVPYIPGSALKGLASSFGHQLFLRNQSDAWYRDFRGGTTRRGEAQQLIFGDEEKEGAIVFYDAMPLPRQWGLYPDVITPHHSSYSQTGERPLLPTDCDEPRPVPFLAGRGVFCFFIGLSATSKVGLSEEEQEALLELATKLLQSALREEGVGAKTSSGYGRFEDFASCA